MKNLLALGKTMSVREVSESMSVPRRTVQEAIQRIETNGGYPPLGVEVQGSDGGKPRREFSEAEVSIISRELKKAHNANPERKGAMTRAERAEIVHNAFSIIHEELREARVENKELRDDRNSLQIQLDENMEWATIKKVVSLGMMTARDERSLWRPLKAYSIKHGYDMHTVPDVNYQNGVLSYHKDVWFAVYGVVLP